MQEDEGKEWQHAFDGFDCEEQDRRRDQEGDLDYDKYEQKLTKINIKLN